MQAVSKAGVFKIRIGVEVAAGLSSGIKSKDKQDFTLSYMNCCCFLVL